MLSDPRRNVGSKLYLERGEIAPRVSGPRPVTGAAQGAFQIVQDRMRPVKLRCFNKQQLRRHARYFHGRNKHPA